MSLTWASCSEEGKSCVGWIESYFKDCVCNPSGEISFALGLVSLFCWGIAEVPQIITNFQTKSGHGVSLAFLLTWILGDIFNLVGCILEPVTLPTQFYTALLYTSSTVVLEVQTVYYEHWIGWWKNRGLNSAQAEVDQEEKNPSNPKLGHPSRPIHATTTAKATDMYYTSARSLANSGTPPFGSSSCYLVAARSGPSGSPLNDDESSEEDAASPTHRRHSNPTARPNRIISRSAGYGTFLLGSAALPFKGKALMEAHNNFSRKRLLQETGMKAMESHLLGILLGWIMAAIYMGGRLPQIYLNIKRGSVEGLNPLMFVFALVANATYVGSILVRSVEWERIKPNAPWLLDAVVCVLLDLFIIIQFAYYKLMHRREARREEEHGSCMEAKKALV